MSSKFKVAKRHFSLLVFIFTFISLLTNFYFWQKNQGYKVRIGKLQQKIQQSEERGLRVIKITDGDTFVLEGGVRVRLADINAPELEFCLGQEAKKRLKELILGKIVQLPFTRPDKFGRLLALVYQGDVWVNQVMLAEGLGRYDSTQTIKTKDQQLLAAAHQAKKEKRGVYSPRCTQKEPPNPRCPIKGNIEKHYRHKIYHLPGCSGYNTVVVERDRGERWFCSEAEAQAAGFHRSEKCYSHHWP